jgi:hypothetical protein
MCGQASLFLCRFGRKCCFSNLEEKGDDMDKLSMVFVGAVLAETVFMVWALMTVLEALRFSLDVTGPIRKEFGSRRLNISSIIWVIVLGGLSAMFFSGAPKLSDDDARLSTVAFVLACVLAGGVLIVAKISIRKIVQKVNWAIKTNQLPRVIGKISSITGGFSSETAAACVTMNKVVVSGVSFRSGFPPLQDAQVFFFAEGEFADVARVGKTVAIFCRQPAEVPDEPPRIEFMVPFIEDPDD